MRLCPSALRLLHRRRQRSSDALLYGQCSAMPQQSSMKVEVFLLWDGGLANQRPSFCQSSECACM